MHLQNIAWFAFMQRSGIGDWPGLGEMDVVVVNAPCQLAMIATPFVKAYRGEALPKTLRCLLPGCTGFKVTRVDDRTLEVRPTGPNIFHCPDVGPVHAAYVFATIDEYFRPAVFKPGSRIVLAGVTMEVLEVDATGLPASVRFRFDAPTDDTRFRWLCFNWQSFRYQEFSPPVPGQSRLVPGPLEGLSDCHRSRLRSRRSHRRHRHIRRLHIGRHRSARREHHLLALLHKW
jgi:hypothetical protein